MINYCATQIIVTQITKIFSEMAVDQLIPQFYLTFRMSVLGKYYNFCPNEVVKASCKPLQIKQNLIQSLKNL